MDMRVRGMSGIDEQKRTELRVRMFFRYEDLFKAITEEDYETGDVLFLDEEVNTQSTWTGINNLMKYARQ